MSNIIQITSNNFNGQYADITFYPCSGGSISLGYQLLPYDYAQDNYEGTYDIYVSAYTLTCQLVIACPSPTPTNTPTMTVTPTVTVTPTMTITPTNTVTPTPTVSPGPAFDADAAAYLGAILATGGTLNATMSAATNTLFTDLKSSGLWNKLAHMYPMLGGTSGSVGIDGRNMATYPSYSMVPILSPTYNSTGFAPNRTGWGRFDNVVTNTFGPSGNNHIGLYVSSAATTTDNGYDLCASDDNNAQQNYIIVRFNNSNTTYYSYIGGYGQTVTDTDSRGHYIMTRNAGNTDTTLYKNGSSIATTTTSFHNCTTQFFLGVEVANGSGTGLGASNSKTYSFAHFGTRLTSGEQSTLASIINTFQTTLGRNTY